MLRLFFLMLSLNPVPLYRHVECLGRNLPAEPKRFPDRYMRVASRLLAEVINDFRYFAVQLVLRSLFLLLLLFLNEALAGSDFHLPFDLFQKHGCAMIRREQLLTEGCNNRFDAQFQAILVWWIQWR